MEKKAPLIALLIGSGALFAAFLALSSPIDLMEEEEVMLLQGDKDINLLYGHHPFLKVKPESNVFKDLPTKSHGKYKPFKAESNVFGEYPSKMDVKKELKLWVIPGHKWHKGLFDNNVFDKKIAQYKWHHNQKGKGRSDDVNVLDGFDYENNDPAYDSEYEIKY